MIPIAILCGGLGKRLTPLTDQLPKSLVNVAGKPFILWQLELLQKHGFTQVVLCTGHLNELVYRAVGDGYKYGMGIHYSWDGPRPLGTVGAIRRALPQLGDEFCTLYGDSYLQCNYQRVVKDFFSQPTMALMTTYKHQDYGLGVWSAKAFEDTEAYNLVDLYHELKEKNLLRYYVMRRRFYEIGSRAGLAQTRRLLGENDETSSLLDVYK